MLEHNRGFSLIELAIVIVIIALVSGSIVAGRAIIRNAEIREMIGELDRYQKAVGEFQQKYGQLPGDFTKAEDYWGSDPDGCPFGVSESAPKRATCNGDGNYFIGTSDGAAGYESSGEWYRVWQHLSNAGLIDVQLNGSSGNAGRNAGEVGINTPASKLESAGWTLAYILANSNSAELYADTYNHAMILGSSLAGADLPAKGPVLSPGEGLDIDTKIDDGKPSLGKMRIIRRATTPTCLTSSGVQSTDTYNTAAGNERVCSALFITGF